MLAALTDAKGDRTSEPPARQRRVLQMAIRESERAAQCLDARKPGHRPELRPIEERREVGREARRRWSGRGGALELEAE